MTTARLETFTDGVLATIGIYWSDHHMFQLTERITGSILWANLNLLFWLSLLPFTTAWLDGPGTQVPTVAAIACYFGAAILWLVPDRRIARVIDQRP